MHKGLTAIPAGQRLKASPNFALGLSFDGRAFIARDSEPYEQYWLSERDRLLFTMFAARRGATVDHAIDGCLKAGGETDGKAVRRRLSRTIGAMRAAGVLLASQDDTSRYTRRIVDAYLAHRPFPEAIARDLVAHAAIGASTRVLDLAGGPGDLALALCRASGAVSMMDLSRGFVASARTRAKRMGLQLTGIHDSCNRLVHRDDSFDVITVSQALHWLDDVQVCRGICRVLAVGGSFFVIHSAIEMDDGHPLATVLGNRSALGAKEHRPFVDEVAPLLRRLALLFEALDAPDVQRIDATQRCGSAATRIVPARVALYRQRRPMGIGFARAFLTDRHIEAAGLRPDLLWADLDARCAAATPERSEGVHHWAVLQFRRGGAAMDPATWAGEAVVELDD